MSVLPASRRAVSVLPESVILAALCLMDMGVTIWLIEQGMAKEANPVMAYYYGFGPQAFAVAKTFLFLAPIALLEYFRPRNPRFIRSVLRLGVILYLAVYALGSLAAN